MWKRTCLTIVLGLFLIQLASAELNITPNPITIQTKLSTSTVFNLTIHNTFPFRIQSFEFKNLSGFTFPSLVLEPNETRTFNFSVNINSMRSETINSQVSFKYLVDIPAQPVTHHINITLNGYNPDFLTIHEGDTVVWSNADDITHTVTGGSFDYELQPNQTVQHVFNSVETVDYQDFILFWAGRIEVLSRSAPQEVNNPNYNKILTVNLDVISDPTTLSINLIDKSFNVDATSEVEGLITIENSGTLPAQRVKLSSNSDWITFKENDFTMEKGTKKYIGFIISPFILETNETNQTYLINLDIKGLNTQQYIENITVFVPFRDITNDQTDPAYILNLIEQFCKRNPSNAFCSPPNSTSGQIIVRDPEIPVNLTASQVYAMLKRIQRIEDSNQRTNNQINSLTTSLEAQLPVFNQQLNESLTQSKASEDNRATNERVWWIVAIFMVLIGGFVVVWKYIEKVQHKKYLMEGYR
jgi:plastocyanin